MRRLDAKLVLGILLTLSMAPISSYAADALLEIREEHWIEAMQIGRVDSDILYAIALQESGTSFNGMRQYGPWPWAMNINGESKFYSSREAARVALEREVEQGNKNVAVGMWQIYLRFNGHLVEDPLDLIDPVTNLYGAAAVLRGCGEIYRTTIDVLSCYHSGDVDEAGLAYAERVLKLTDKWGRPFRMSQIPGEVHFTRASASVAPRDVRRVLIVEGENATTDVDTGTSTTRTLTMLATAKKPFETASHAEFLETLASSDTSEARRVIVVD